MIWRTPKYTGPERRKTPRRKLRPLRALLALLALAAAGYVAAALWLMAQETRIVFEAVQTLGDARPAVPYERVDLPGPEESGRFAWAMRQSGAPDAPWALYLHGSPSTVASPVNIAHYALLHEAGLQVLAPEYRGFGGVRGTPSERGLLEDARAAYDYLRTREGVPPHRIVLYGWSLGGAVAIDLAAHVDAGAVILEGAPASVADLNQKRYPFFPVRLLMRNAFESAARIAHVVEPVLFLHAPEDAVVPFADSGRLFAATPGRKQLLQIAGGHVTAIEVDGDRIRRAVRAFLQEHGIAAPEPRAD